MDDRGEHGELTMAQWLGRVFFIVGGFFEILVFLGWLLAGWATGDWRSAETMAAYAGIVGIVLMAVGVLIANNAVEGPAPRSVVVACAVTLMSVPLGVLVGWPAGVVVAAIGVPAIILAHKRYERQRLSGQANSQSAVQE